MDVGNFSGSSAFSKTSLNIWKFTVHILLKPGLENSEHHFTSVWDECNCAVVWAFFGIAFLWDWNENWPFPVLWPLLHIPNLLAYWGQHFHHRIGKVLHPIPRGLSKELPGVSGMTQPPQSPEVLPGKAQGRQNNLLLRDTLAQHPFCLTVLVRRNQEGLGFCKHPIGLSDTIDCVSLLCFLDENTLKIIVLKTLNMRSTLWTNLQVNKNTVLLTRDERVNRTRTYGKTFYNLL